MYLIALIIAPKATVKITSFNVVATLQPLTKFVNHLSFYSRLETFHCILNQLNCSLL